MPELLSPSVMSPLMTAGQRTVVSAPVMAPPSAAVPAPTTVTDVPVTALPPQPSSFFDGVIAAERRLVAKTAAVSETLAARFAMPADSPRVAVFRQRYLRSFDEDVAAGAEEFPKESNESDDLEGLLQAVPEAMAFSDPDRQLWFLSKCELAVAFLNEAAAQRLLMALLQYPPSVPIAGSWVNYLQTVRVVLEHARPAPGALQRSSDFKGQLREALLAQLLTLEHSRSSRQNYERVLGVVDIFISELPELAVIECVTLFIALPPDEAAASVYHDFLNKWIARINMGPLFEALSSLKLVEKEPAFHIIRYIEANHEVIPPANISKVASNMTLFLGHASPAIRYRFRELIRRFYGEISDDKKSLVAIEIARQMRGVPNDLRLEAADFLKELHASLPREHQLDTLFAMAQLIESAANDSEFTASLQSLFEAMFDRVTDPAAAFRHLFAKILPQDDLVAARLLRFFKNNAERIPDETAQRELWSVARLRLGVHLPEAPEGQDFAAALDDLIHAVQISRIHTLFDRADLIENAQPRLGQTASWESIFAEAKSLFTSVPTAFHERYVAAFKTELAREGDFAGRFYLWLYFGLPPEFEFVETGLFAPDFGAFVARIPGYESSFAQAKMAASDAVARYYFDKAERATPQEALKLLFHLLELEPLNAIATAKLAALIVAHEGEGGFDAAKGRFLSFGDAIGPAVKRNELLAKAYRERGTELLAKDAAQAKVSFKTAHAIDPFDRESIEALIGMFPQTKAPNPFIQGELYNLYKELLALALQDVGVVIRFCDFIAREHVPGQNDVAIAEKHVVANGADGKAQMAAAYRRRVAAMAPDSDAAQRKHLYAKVLEFDADDAVAQKGWIDTSLESVAKVTQGAFDVLLPLLAKMPDSQALKERLAQAVLDELKLTKGFDFAAAERRLRESGAPGGGVLVRVYLKQAQSKEADPATADAADQFYVKAYDAAPKDLSVLNPFLNWLAHSRSKNWQWKRFLVAAEICKQTPENAVAWAACLDAFLRNAADTAFNTKEAMAFWDQVSGEGNAAIARAVAVLWAKHQGFGQAKDEPGALRDFSRLESQYAENSLFMYCRAVLIEQGMLPGPPGIVDDSVLALEEAAGSVSKPALEDIARLADPKALLSDLSRFVKDQASLSDRDFIRIVEMIPKGQNWGRNNTIMSYHMALEKSGAGGIYPTRFDTIDKEIIMDALNKLKRIYDRDKLLASLPKIEAIVDASHSEGLWEYGGDVASKTLNYKTHLKSLFAVELRKKLAIEPVGGVKDRHARRVARLYLEVLKRDKSFEPAWQALLALADSHAFLEGVVEEARRLRI